MSFPYPVNRLHRVWRYFLILTLLFPVLLHAQDDNRRQIDSLLRVISSLEGREKLNGYRDLANFVFMNENAMDSVDKYYRLYGREARVQKDVLSEGLSLLSPVGAMFNRSLYSDAVKRGREIKPFLYKNQLWEQYYTCCVHIVNAMFYQGLSDQAQREARETYEEARDNGHLTGVASMLRVMGDMYTGNDLYDDAEACYRESLETEKRIDGLREQRLYAYSALAGILGADGKYDQAEAVMKEWEAYQAEWHADRVKKGTVSSSAWEANLYQRYMELYYAQGDWEKAWDYCEKLDGLGNISIMQRQAIAQYRMVIELERGNYANAYRWSLQYYEISSQMGYTSNANGALMFKAIILAYMGDPAATDAAIEEFNVAMEKTYAESSSTQLNELRTIYEVDKLQAQKRAQRNYLLLALGLCVLLVVVLVIWILYSRKLKIRNHGLVRRLQEQDRLMGELTEAQENIRKLRSLVKEGLASSDMESDIYIRLVELMKDREVYTNPDVSRESVARLLGTNETYLHAAVRKYLGKSFGEYIASLRLNLAREMLSQDASYTIEAVAEACGFGARNTFHRLFREQYGLTPHEYRSISIHILVPPGVTPPENYA